MSVYDEVPVAELTLRGLGRHLINAYMLRENDFTEQVKLAVERALSEEMIELKIQKAANDFMEQVIKDIFNNYKLRQTITSQIVEKLIIKTEVST